MDFICFSINAWEKRKARKQQFMQHLSLRGDVNKVLYVEPPLNIWRLFFEWAGGESRRRWARALKGRPERISDKFLVFTPIFFIPFAFRLRWVYRANLYFSYLRIRRLARSEGMREVVIWLYHPFDHPLLQWFKDRKISCFDWAEDWAQYFTEYSESFRRRIAGMEERIVREADLVFVVSRHFLERARALNPHAFHIRDGAVPEIFSDPVVRFPEDLKGIGHPAVGYVGTVSHRIDIGLLQAVSERLADFSFIFVGDIHQARADITPLLGRPNIFFLGGKPYEDLPGYMAFFDVCILPYKAVPFTPAPTKVFDYLAAGKPIVATASPELDFLESFVYFAQSPEAFAEGIRSALRDVSVGETERRKEKARQNSWAERATEIMDLINKRLSLL
jgi:glycosyltransferase involved in cell wall biosynthesis